jgi:uncharacterized membrane protein
MLLGGLDMSLTPEERRKIYEEEKARIEAEQQAKLHKPEVKANPLEGLSQNVAGLLCYIGGWISGIVFLVLEQKNDFVRFHAAQSIVVFGTLNLASMVLGWIPGVGGIFTGLAAAFSIVFWIVLMIKAYQGELYKLPIAGEIAELLASKTKQSGSESSSTVMQAAPSTASDKATGKISSRLDQFQNTRVARITASAFAIAWSIVLLVLFNSFNQYIAYYNGETVNGVTVWARYPLFTQDINRWLPILTLTLALSIIVHIFLIIFDKPVLRELAGMALDVFGLATVLNLLSIFPFDFSVIPDSTAADMTGMAVTIVLISIAVGIGVSLLVRLIKFIIALAAGKTG